ncbi:MAG: flagellar hook protein FlgE [Rubrivivax sp.]|jgi:flagellar hook protein FlgE|nr:flagellar hook protein FlgE [Rubrivivax sp.]MBK8529095.1 flagellar hook protein FlgE [Rubrivivax sp.]
MSFQQGLSGLNATSKNLEVIGNNIANAGTYGAKAARAEFSDFYAAALGGGSGSQVGMGTKLATVAQQFTQGSVVATDNPLDIAINGAGFFQVSDGVGTTKYSRNGQFKLDNQGYIVNNTGLKLMGYSADQGTGQIQAGLALPLQLPTGGIAPKPTTDIKMQFNLDSTKSVTVPAAAPLIDFNDSTSYNNATSLTVYDAKGQPVAMTYYFQRATGKTAANPTDPDAWNVFMTANGATVGGTEAAPDPVFTVTFTDDGKGPTATSLGAINTANGHVELTLPDIQGGPVSDKDDDPGNNTLPLLLSGMKMDIDVTQFASPFGVTDLSQNGFSAGKMVSIGIESNGIVTARYSNGQTKSAGQIEVANFRNLQGLQPLGNNMWGFTYASGDPVTGVPGEGNLGVLQAGALEESNIDMTAELVNMITAQRAYQANAQTIKTLDQVMQTLVNLR